MPVEITQKNFIDKLIEIEKFTLKLCAKERKCIYIDMKGHKYFRLGKYNIILIEAYNVGNRFLTLRSDDCEIWVNTVKYNREFVVFDRNKDVQNYFLKEVDEVLEEFLIEAYKSLYFLNDPKLVIIKIEDF